jgi:hypothetical protein
MSQEFPSDVVQAIKDSVKTEVITIDGRQFATRPVFDPPELPDEPLPGTVQLHTLTGLVQFVQGFPEDGQIGFIQVLNHQTVYVWGKVTGHKKVRPLYAVAAVPDAIRRHSFKFGSYLSVEDFIIGIQTGFAPTGDRAALLALVGNLKDESVRTLADDGVTQTVTARQGVSLVGEVKVPNPVSLAPYRTFAEVDQPLTAFILRVQRGKEGGLPTVGLFETNDGQWEIGAIQKIQDFIEDEITDIPVIA